MKPWCRGRRLCRPTHWEITNSPKSFVKTVQSAGLFVPPHCTTAARRPHGRICSFSFGDLSDSRRKSRLSADSTKNIQKNFRKIFNCGRRKSNGMRAVSVVLSAARCVHFAASTGRKLKKSNRTGAQIRRKQNHSHKNGRYPEMLSASGLQNVKAVCALRRIWGGTCSPACFPRARTL